jgi:hypothetical protein
MCSSGTCHHGVDWAAVIRKIYPVPSRLDDYDHALVLTYRPSDLDAFVRRLTPDELKPEPRIGKPKRNKVRSKMAKATRRRNRQ